MDDHGKLHPGVSVKPVSDYTRVLTRGNGGIEKFAKWCGRLGVHRETGPLTYRQLAKLLNPNCPQSSRVGRWVEAKEKLNAANAYAIGRALEKLGRPCSGLDSLIAAGHWADALACIGEYLYDATFTPDTDPEEKRVLSDVFAKRLHDKALPPAMYPAMDEAWEQWAKNSGKDISHFAARIQAAYMLAKSIHLEDHPVALQVLARWEPVGFFISRKVRKSETL